MSLNCLAQSEFQTKIEKAINDTYGKDDAKFKILVTVFGERGILEKETYKYAKMKENIFIDYNTQLYVENKEFSLIVNHEEKLIEILKSKSSKPIFQFDLATLKQNNVVIQQTVNVNDTIYNVYHVLDKVMHLSYEIHCKNNKFWSFTYYPKDDDIIYEKKIVKLNIIIVEERDWKSYEVQDIVQKSKTLGLKPTQKYKSYSIEYLD